MRNLRPFAWVIIAVNVYFLFTFFKGVNELEQDNLAIGLFSILLLSVWAIINVILYVIYRVTSRSKSRVCPACASKVAVGITVCGRCGFDFMKAAIPSEERKSPDNSPTKEFIGVERNGKFEWKIPVISFIILSLIIVFFSNQSPNAYFPNLAHCEAPKPF